MGSGTGIASARIENGGSLTMATSASALNGAVTVQAGGRFDAALAGGVTGSGQLTFDAGSLINITNATGFSGSQATAASIAAGTIVRLNANSFGAAGTTLDSVLGSGSNAPIFVIYGNNRTAANPTDPDTAILTLNKDINGVGGILTNYELSNRGLGTTTNGFVALGARGGTIAATTGNLMGISEDIRGVGSLTIGTTDIIDGLPKLGTVELNAVNTYTGGTIVNAGTLKTLNTSALGSTSGQLTVNTGGTLEMNNNSLTVGNLTGTGGVINGGVSGSRTLTIGQGDTGGGNYQGSIQNGAGGTTALTKTGTGTITLSGVNSYTGATNINVGTLIVNGNISTSTLTTVQTGATLGGSGTVGKTIVNGTLAVGNSPGQMDFTNTLGLQAAPSWKSMAFRVLESLAAMISSTSQVLAQRSSHLRWHNDPRHGCPVRWRNLLMEPVRHGQRDRNLHRYHTRRPVFRYPQRRLRGLDTSTNADNESWTVHRVHWRSRSRRRPRAHAPRCSAASARSCSSAAADTETVAAVYDRR